MLSKQKPQEPRSGHASPEPGSNLDRRLAQRHGRERGLRLFVPATVLELAGIDPNGEPPAYTVQHVKDGRRSRATILVRLYPPAS